MFFKLFNFLFQQDSWKKKLKMKFQNLRWPERSQKAGLLVPPPPAKKQKKYDTIEASPPTASDLAEYEQHVTHLMKVYTSKKLSLAYMVSLLELTAKLCRLWIKEELPSVPEVIDKFPCLVEPKIVC